MSFMNAELHELGKFSRIMRDYRAFLNQEAKKRFEEMSKKKSSQSTKKGNSKNVYIPKSKRPKYSLNFTMAAYKRSRNAAGGYILNFSMAQAESIIESAKFLLDPQLYQEENFYPQIKFSGKLMKRLRGENKEKARKKNQEREAKKHFNNIKKGLSEVGKMVKKFKLEDLDLGSVLNKKFKTSKVKV